jgi:FMN phosphatase YigB (HAD superfamily)
VQITTFDFHNTVAYCDPWFDLEIRDLPARVLDTLPPRTGVPSPAAIRAEATSRYRDMRGRIMESGIEVDALESVAHVFRTMGLDVDRQAIERAIDELMRQALSHLAPVPGSVETILNLIGAGVPVGIISSAVYHPFLEWSMARFGLLERLAFIATSASVGYYKSDVRIYHHAYREASATIELGVHVGDSPRWDVDTAKQAGLGTVLYADNNDRRQQTRATDLAKPDLVLDSLVGADRAILELLQQRRTGQGAR